MISCPADGCGVAYGYYCQSNSLALHLGAKCVINAAQICLHGSSVIQVNDRSGEPKELSIPCFRCGVCCTKYQVRLSLVEARQIADELGFDWDEWLDRYVDQRK